MKSLASAPNKTTTPAANAVLATLAIAASSTGRSYDITIYAAFYNTAPAAADAANIQLRVGGTVQFAIPVVPVSATWQVFKYKVRIPAAGATVDLQAIALGTTGTTYMTQIVADSGSN